MPSQYLKAEAVMLKPGLVPGSNGRLLYDDQLLRDRPQRWRGKPVTVNHPTDSSGRNVSARDKPNSIVGVIEDSFYRSGKLVGKLRINRRLLPDHLKAKLDLGEKIEVSTGLFTSSDEKGRIYEYRPDHLALLETEEGACSVKAGCGIRSMAYLEPTANSIKESNVLLQTHADLSSIRSPGFNGEAPLVAPGWDEEEVEVPTSNCDRCHWDYVYDDRLEDDGASFEVNESGVTPLVVPEARY